MSLVYAWEKLFLAVETLCGHGSQNARLVNAATLGLIHLRPEDLPSELRGEFIQLMSDLTADHAGDEEASVKATIRAFDVSDQENSVRTILIIFSVLCRHLKVL